MLIKKAAFCPGLRFFLFFSSGSFFAGVKKGRAYRAYTRLLPRASIPTGIHFPLTPPKPPRGSCEGVEVTGGSERPNEFLSSRLLPKPSITAAWSGETRLGDVFVRVVVGRGRGEEEGASKGASEFSQDSGC